MQLNKNTNNPALFRSKDGCNGADSRHRSSAGAASVVVPLLASLALLRFNNFGAVK